VGVEQRITELVNRRLGSWLRQAEQALMAEKARVLKPLGLSVPQYTALHALSVASLSGAQLARVCCVTPQSMASMLSTLESRELIDRDPSEAHAMVLIATLTPAGRALFEQADIVALAVERRLSAAFTKPEDEQLRELLARSIEILSNAAAAEPGTHSMRPGQALRSSSRRAGAK
jgi:DNA-binding MarR family transcriptional regulator